MANDRSHRDLNAAVFAATGAIAGATALELAKRGARLFLSGRDLGRLQALAARIGAQTGAQAECCVVDAESPADVARYLQSLAERGVAPDWVFNGIGVDPEQARYGERSDAISLSCFLEPMLRIAGSQFLTATLAAKEMARRGRGTIVLLTSALAKSALPYMAGITAASDAVQGLARVLSAEYGPQGVRVLCVRVAGIPESRTIRLTSAANARTLGIAVEQFAAAMVPEGGGKSLTLEAAAAGIVAATVPGAAAPIGQPVDIEA